MYFFSVQGIYIFPGVQNQVTKPVNLLIAILFLLFWLGIVAPVSAQDIQISPSNKNITYAGRIGFDNKNGASIYWPGSSIKIKFKGTAISATIKDLSGNNFFYVIVDQQKEGIVKLKLDTALTTYPLAKNLPNGVHTIELFKVTNPSIATQFYGFRLPKGAKLLKPDKQRVRAIEFYGNSITVGHGVEVHPDSADTGDKLFFNNYLSYAAITARHFNAQYSCIARSGIGIMLSWFHEIMPEIYDRINPFDSSSKWDFNKYTPQVVVINLFQNDYWLTNMPEHAQFKARFGTVKPSPAFIIQAYQQFLKQVRSKYKRATIICTLGSMNATEEGSLWPGYIMKAIENTGDKNVLHHFYPFKKTPGHPKVKEQEVMAKSLIAFIEKNIKW